MSPVRRVRRVTADPDGRPDRHLGQATVEFVLMLPLLLLLTLAIVQVGLLVRTPRARHPRGTRGGARGGRGR